MSEILTPVENLSPGDTFEYWHGGKTHTVTVQRAPERAGRDAVGNSVWRVWCRTGDGREGWMIYGTGAHVILSREGSRESDGNNQA